MMIPPESKATAGEYRFTMAYAVETTDSINMTIFRISIIMSACFIQSGSSLNIATLGS